MTSTIKYNKSPSESYELPKELKQEIEKTVEQEKPQKRTRKKKVEEAPIVRMTDEEIEQKLKEEEEERLARFKTNRQWREEKEKKEQEERKAKAVLTEEEYQAMVNAQKNAGNIEQEEIESVVSEEIKPEINTDVEWSIPITQDVYFFDTRLSYELTGYRPISYKQGLNFNPEWFTEARNTFKRTGHYCQHPRQSKAFADFWDQEYIRCMDGYTSHGFTITGDHYFFLNYYQLLDLTSATKAGQGRVYDFPKFYVAQYEFFHYLEMCKRLRKNAVLMKARGVGFSEMDAAIAANTYNCRRNSVTVITASQDNYLVKTLDKVWKALTFLNDFTDGGFFKLSQVTNTQYAKKASHYKMLNGQKIESGWMSQITGIIADKPNKIRGDRADLLIFEECGCHIAGTQVIMADGKLKNVENVKIGDKLLGPDNTPRKVLELHTGQDMMYKITPVNGDPQIVNSKHLIYTRRGNKYVTITAQEYFEKYQKYNRVRDYYKLVKTNQISFPHKDVPIDPYLFGFWLGDGDTNRVRFTNADKEVINYLINYANDSDIKYSVAECDNAPGCFHIYYKSNHGNSILNSLKELGVLGKKDIPDIYMYNSREVLLGVLAGLIDSDGTYNKRTHVIEITQSYDKKHIIEKCAFICRVLGMRVSVSTRMSKERMFKGKLIKGGVLQYRLRILFGHEEIPTLIKRKQTKERDKTVYRASKDPLACTFKIEEYGIDTYYGFSLDKDQLFLTSDFTICHNSWVNSIKAFLQGDALVGIQGARFGIKLAGGTGGDTGPALEGLRDMYYNPDVYDVLPFRHNYTYTGEETFSSYFIPAFSIVNTSECMDDRGYTDPNVGKQYYNRIREKKAKDPKALIIYSAEYCFNAEEAFSLEGDNKFNKVYIAEQLSRIRVLKQTPNIETGFLEYKFKDGLHAEENIDGFRWIKNVNGKIKILEHPLWTIPDEKDINDKVIRSYPKEKIRNLYVIGIDGIDIGQGQTSEYTKNASDFCLVVKKRVYGLEEPQYVALYKDRPNDIREAYKIAVKMAQYYNAQINIEATRQSIIPWARDRKLLHLFMRRPKATLTDSIRNTNKQYGTPATAAIIAHQTDLIADYINDYCHTIWFEEMLDEFNRYTDENKGKFDIVASVAMAELADEELSGVVPKALENRQDSWQDIGYYTDMYGNRRYGALPSKRPTILTNNNFGPSYDDVRIRTSDTRVYSGYD